MKKLFAIIILSVLVLGCAAEKEEGDVIEGLEELGEDQIINCPDCDDGDVCTTDICVGKEKKCVFVPIKKCCGDNVCEDGENCLTCEEDCGTCYGLPDLQRDIYKLYRRKIALAKNRVIGKRYGEVPSTEYDFYDSVFITAIEIKDREDFLMEFKDFEEFIELIAHAKFENFIIKLGENYPNNDYEFTANYSTEATGTLTGEMVEYKYWSRIYQKFRSCAICNNENESYETKSLVDPVLDGMIYIQCTPSLVIGIYSNQPQMLDKFWTNLNEEEYDAQIVKWLYTEARGAFDEAASLLESCSTHE